MLIDTNVWSELARARPDRRVCDWMSDHFQSCILSTIVLGEILYGIALAEDDRRRDLQSFLDDMLQRLPIEVADFDVSAATSWGPMRARLKQTGKLIGERDMLIAAHAMALDIPLVTRNVSEMARTGATIINPWDA